VAKKIKVLLSKVGMDTHDRGVKIIARALRDSGMEVIYAGIYQTTEQIVRASVQEDVDVVGVSSLDGGHMTIFPEIVEGLKREGRGDIVVIGGGVIPLDEAEELKKMGVSEIFRAGSVTDDIVKYVQKHAK